MAPPRISAAMLVSAGATSSLLVRNLRDKYGVQPGVDGTFAQVLTDTETMNNLSTPCSVVCPSLRMNLKSERHNVGRLSCKGRAAVPFA